MTDRNNFLVASKIENQCLRNFLKKYAKKYFEYAEENEIKKVSKTHTSCATLQTQAAEYI